MSKAKESAFPSDVFAVHKDLPKDQILKIAASQGLTKRELFAAMAMQGWCANSSRDGTSEQFAKAAVAAADALLKELEK